MLTFNYFYYLLLIHTYTHLHALLCLLLYLLKLIFIYALRHWIVCTWCSCFLPGSYCKHWLVLYTATSCHITSRYIYHWKPTDDLTSKYYYCNIFTACLGRNSFRIKFYLFLCDYISQLDFCFFIFWRRNQFCRFDWHSKVNIYKSKHFNKSQLRWFIY